MLYLGVGTNARAFPLLANRASAAARPLLKQGPMWCVLIAAQSSLTTGKKCAFFPQVRNSVMPRHMWKLRQTAEGMGAFKVMNRQHRVRAVQLIALVFCYFWYNAAIRGTVVKALS